MGIMLHVVDGDEEPHYDALYLAGESVHDASMSLINQSTGEATVRVYIYMGVAVGRSVIPKCEH